jgi:hypothetical protein
MFIWRPLSVSEPATIKNEIALPAAEAAQSFLLVRQKARESRAPSSAQSRRGCEFYGNSRVICITAMAIVRARLSPSPARAFIFFFTFFD